MDGKLGLFRLAGVGFAVPLRRLLCVLDRVKAEPLPLLPKGMAGMLVIEDEIIPLVHSGFLPGVDDGVALAAEFKVLVTTEYGTLALPADVTVGVVAQNRCEALAHDPVADFWPEAVGYRQNRYLVLNVDIFIMDLICP
jgi:hypothetical protein